MEKRRLGKTDIDVSKICLGTMTWGHQNTEQEAHEQLDYAVDHGINFIDTAELYAVPPQADTYTLTEQYIGNWFAKTGKRSEVVLASKVAGPNFPWIRNNAGFARESILEAIDGSLKRLQTDYIDLYQLHWPDRPVPLRGKLNYADEMRDTQNEYEAHFVEILETLQEIQKAGKVRHFGLSNETPWGTMKFLELAEKHDLPRMVSIQNAYSMLRRDFEVGLAEVCLQEKVSMLPYSPLAGGILTGKYLNGQSPEGARFSTWGKDRMGYYLSDRVMKVVGQYAELAKELSITPTQLALAFVNDRVFVTSNIIGATSMEQLKECISSAEISLSKETYQKVDAIFSEHQNVGCW